MLWRWAFTLTIVASAVGISATAWDKTIDHLTSPNVAVLVVEEAFVLSVAGTFIYLLTLLNDKAPPAGLWSIVVILTMVEIGIFFSWLVAPVHSRELKSVYLYGAHMLSVQIFAVLFFVTVMCELMASAVFTIRLTRAIHADDPTGQFGGWIIAVSTVVGAAVFLLATCLVFIRPNTASTAVLAGVLRNVCALIVIGVMAGAVVMFGGPRLLRFRSQRRYALCVRPLWAGLTELFPVITLDRHPSSFHALISSNGLERMLIEIHDGLDLLLVKDGTKSSKDIADHIFLPYPEDESAVLVSASKFLPPMTNEEEEREVLCSLADEYRQRRISRFGKSAIHDQ